MILSPIGKPINNCKVVVVDRNLHPCPVGVPGELCIGGIGVGAGYLNNPELTSDKFVRNPFPELGSEQLYKTGDLARYLPDGAIEYLGRLDHQVKIRGFRIELGEIESVLAGFPGVREAVLLAREDIPGDKRLAAYLTVKEGETPKDLELRGLLRAKLPEYMIPSAFVILDRFPLTPNGKVDRKALPRPEPQSSNLGGFAPPDTETEKALADIWCKLLEFSKWGYTITSSSWAAIRCWRREWPRGRSRRSECACRCERSSNIRRLPVLPSRSTPCFGLGITMETSCLLQLRRLKRASYDRSDEFDACRAVRIAPQSRDPSLEGGGSTAIPGRGWDADAGIAAAIAGAEVRDP